MPVTIVFRGLMVLGQAAPKTGRIQLGVLRAPNHFPRILTMKNGVLAGIFDLRRRPELDRVRDWSIHVTNPSPSGIDRREDGRDFDRLANHQPWDFRWIADLEGRGLHERDLTEDLDTSRLRLVINVDHGSFATRLQSPIFLRRQVVPAGGTTRYGMTAAVTECVISTAGGSVSLMVDGTEAFAFPDVANTLYEISNAPPDVNPSDPNPGGGHFHMYYDHLFRPRPRERFDLEVQSMPPAPDPALCGVTFLGLRRTEL
ncbi:MAG: hypothetical protein LC794_10265 [Acidobacteria bacterium]|nr:hypothetical protein [Acidobacteriota bacterium]MCA1627051.1 hypothetical protein [Acidobacteriota bacterium]